MGRWCRLCVWTRRSGSGQRRTALQDGCALPWGCGLRGAQGLQPFRLRLRRVPQSPGCSTQRGTRAG